MGKVTLRVWLPAASSNQVLGLITVNKNGDIVSLGFVSYKLNLWQLEVFTHEGGGFGVQKCGNKAAGWRNRIFSSNVCPFLKALCQDHLYPVGLLAPLKYCLCTLWDCLQTSMCQMKRSLAIRLRDSQNLCLDNMPCCHSNNEDGSCLFSLLSLPRFI